MEESPQKREGLHTRPTRGDPHKDLKDQLAQFFLSLIQAFLRTGYYTPDHPEAQKARVGLYEAFQGLLDDKDELTFLVRDAPEGSSILIEGVLPEPQDLNGLMFQGMAEMYTPRFAKFLERKDLVSLTLKKKMAEEEFTRFVEVMGEPAFVDTREKDNKERFALTLKSQGIANISYIFNEEILATKRMMPWRARLAISRLKKDFKMVPLFYNLDAEGLKAVRCEIIREVARPIQDAGVIYPLLMNSDLAESEEIKEPEIEKEMVASLPNGLLLGVSKKFLKEASGNGKTLYSLEKWQRLAREFARALKSRQILGREAVLEAFFKTKLIPLEELPEAAQRKIKVELFLQKFLRDSEAFLRKLDAMHDGETYAKAARYLRAMIPELLRRDRYEAVLKIISRIDRHAKDNDDRAPYARQVLEKIKAGKIPIALKGKFLASNSEMCQAIVPIFDLLGEAAVPHLLDILKQTQDPWILKSAFETLTRIDPSTVDSVLQELKGKERATGFGVRIIRVLGALDYGESTHPFAETLKACLRHENPRLREEALLAYYNVAGDDGEALYLEMLQDPDIGVQKRAIQCLGRIRSQEGLKKFLRVLQRGDDLDSDQKKQLEAPLFKALGYYGNIPWTETGTLEDFLLETLDRELNPGPLKFLKKKSSPLSEQALNAIFDSLGKVGTDKSRALLKKVEKQQGNIWMKKAADTLRRIDSPEEDWGVTDPSLSGRFPSRV